MNCIIKKTLSLLCLLLATGLLQAQNKEHYILLIDGDSLRVDLNKDLKYTLKSGKEIDLKLVQPDLLTYEDEMLTFLYPNAVTLSKIPVEEGLIQIMAMRATGNGVLVQEYNFINPESIIDLILNEITKESLNYGYSKKEEPYSLDLKSGQTLKGKRIIMEYNGEKEIYTAFAHGKKDQGVLLIVLNTVENDEDTAILNTILNSLELNF
ncbi:hypothetical protein [Leeuwenhoekiella sp. H156]|uniref:hypothetical protein n=1 Tax=Leeuwenhoekiella sp. H156 TaxID=3450128 RepID=UPI003FA411FD